MPGQAARASALRPSRYSARRGEVAVDVGGLADDPLPVALQAVGVEHAGLDGRVEPPGLLVRGHRRVEQAGVAAGVHQPGEELGIDRRLGPAQQPPHRVDRAAGVALELRVVLVQHRQVRIEALRPLEGSLGLGGLVGQPRGTCRSRAGSGPARPTPARTASRASRTAGRRRGPRGCGPSRGPARCRAGTARRPRRCAARRARTTRLS